MKETRKFVIDNKQLEDAFPELYKAYRNTFGSQRPKIDVDTTEDYLFSAEIQDGRSDYFKDEVYFIFNNGRVIEFDSSDESSANEALAAKLKGKYHLTPNDAVLECHTGYAKYCTLVVHPSFINQQMLPNNSTNDITLSEQYALILIASYISAARFKNFVHPYTYRDEVSMDGWKCNEKELKKDIKDHTPNNNYKEAWENVCKALQAKGYVKISSNGSVAITMNGKNRAIALKGR
jgi:hypothetical protein